MLVDSWFWCNGSITVAKRLFFSEYIKHRWAISAQWGVLSLGKVSVKCKRSETKFTTDFRLTQLEVFIWSLASDTQTCV